MRDKENVQAMLFKLGLQFAQPALVRHVQSLSHAQLCIIAAYNERPIAQKTIRRPRDQGRRLLLLLTCRVLTTGRFAA